MVLHTRCRQTSGTRPGGTQRQTSLHARAMPAVQGSYSGRGAREQR